MKLATRTILWRGLFSARPFFHHNAVTPYRPFSATADASKTAAAKAQAFAQLAKLNYNYQHHFESGNVLTQMARQFSPPTPETADLFNAFIVAYMKMGWSKQALEVTDAMTRQGIVPLMSSFLAIIADAMNKRNIDLVVRVLDQMLKVHSSPPLIFRAAAWGQGADAPLGVGEGSPILEI